MTAITRWLLRKITTNDMITEQHERMVTMRAVITLIHSDE